MKCCNRSSISKYVTLSVRVYSEYRHEQSGVAEQSDDGDRLRSARGLDFLSLFIENANKEHDLEQMFDLL